MDREAVMCESDLFLACEAVKEVSDESFKRELKELWKHQTNKFSKGSPLVDLSSNKQVW